MRTANNNSWRDDDHLRAVAFAEEWCTLRRPSLANETQSGYEMPEPEIPILKEKTTPLFATDNMPAPVRLNQKVQWQPWAKPAYEWLWRDQENYVIGIRAFLSKHGAPLDLFRHARRLFVDVTIVLPDGPEIDPMRIVIWATRAAGIPPASIWHCTWGMVCGEKERIVLAVWEVPDGKK